MIKFSLATKDTLPETVTVDGSVYFFNTDFKTILRCFKLFDDDKIPEEHKPFILMRMFFKDAFPENGFDVFMDFVRCGEEESFGSDDNDFDFEQDAMEIYSGFMQLYGIDIVDTNMHWYKFKALLGGVFSANTALANKVSIRHSNDNDSKRKADAERTRKNVEIKTKLSKAEIDLQKEIARRLEAGESLEGVI